MLRRFRIRRSRVLLSMALVGSGLLLFAFPGRRLPLAFTIGTGIGVKSLQARIDQLEDQAIHRQAFTSNDTAFLNDFYATLATGAKLSVVVSQTGRLMQHYLDGSGSDYELEPSIFTDNTKVRSEMARLRKRAEGTPCASGDRLSSRTFHMPDPSKLDSVFGLYYGTLHLSRSTSLSGACVQHFRAEVPWNWPSYPSLKAKHGTFHAESFPLPNLKAALLGKRHALFVDNGLGQYLVQLGLARPFLAYAEWDEETFAGR